MACIKSTAWYVGSAAGGGSGGEDRGSRGSERTESARLSNTGSHGEADIIEDKSARSRSCFFGPSTVIVS
jgi:hypothetical protein